MKQKVILFITGVMTLTFFGCNNDEIYQEEQYKTSIYLLSGADNIFVVSFTLNEAEPVRYISIGCGGSTANEKDVVVTLEPNPDMLDRYNYLNYDFESQYAKLLPADRYELASYSVTLPANSNYHYARIPIKVRTLGLSPDTIYFVPLKIKSVSEYEVNENKQDVLYRVAIENDYAKQLVPTYYAKSGTMSNPLAVLSGTKQVFPLEKDKVRMFVGNDTYGVTTTVADIARLSVVVQIRPDNTLLVTPYGPTMEVEMLDELNGYNLYDPSLMQGTVKQRVLYLNYRFRYKNADGTFTGWRNVEERLIRIEET